MALMTHTSGIDMKPNCIIKYLPRCHLRRLKHGAPEVDGASRFEEELELGLAHEVAVGLRANAPLDVVCAEDGLLQLDLKN